MCSVTREIKGDYSAASNFKQGKAPKAGKQMIYKKLNYLH